MSTPNLVLLVALVVAVGSGLLACVVPIGDGGEVFVTAAVVAVCGAPVGYLAAHVAADRRAEVAAVERYGRKRNLPVTDPPARTLFPAEASLTRWAAVTGLVAGRAVEVTVNGRRGYLFLAHYRVQGTAGETVTAPALLIPGGLPASATFRIVPQGLLHNAGVPVGSNYRVEAVDPRAARSSLPPKLTGWLGDNPGLRVEVIGGTVVAWAEATTGDVLRNAARSPAAVLPERFDKLLELAGRLVPTADPA